MDGTAYPYRTRIEWKTRRRAALRSEGLPEMEVSTPPEFKGEPGYWTPEHLYVAAIESCLMGTFIGIADKSGVQVTAYRSSATGVMKTAETGLQFTGIEIDVTVELQDESSRSRAESVMDRALGSCPIGKSVTAPLRVNTAFIVRSADEQQKELASAARE